MYVLFMEIFFFSGGASVGGVRRRHGTFTFSAFRLSSETERCIIPAHPKQANFPRLSQLRERKEKQKFSRAGTAAEK